MEKIKVKCSIVKVSFGRTQSGKEFAFIEGLSPDVGIFKAFVPPDVGKAAQSCVEYAENTYMYVQLYTGRDYSVRCRVTDVTIE